MPGSSYGGLDTDVVVVGAGPYGLSVSAHLSALGVRHEIFGETMEMWGRHMPVGMYLKSEGFASNLSDPSGEYTLERFCAEDESGYEYARIAAPIPLDTFERYGRWFQKRLVPGVRENRVNSVKQTGAVFEVRLDTGDTLRGKSVVMATGMTGYVHLPRPLQDLPSKAVVHTYDQRDPGRSRGTDVAVIGAGQSALESAALMHEQGAKVWVIARASKLAWNSRPGGPDRPLRARWRYPESGLGEGRSQWLYANYPLVFHRAPEARRRRHAYSALGPAGAWWLRARIEGRIDLLLGRTVSGAEVEDDGVRLRLQGPTGAQEELYVSAVIAGTGYRADVTRLSLLDSSLRKSIATATSIPVLDRTLASSVAGLYFIGYSAGLSFGPVMRFVYGADFAARRLARQLAK